MVKEEKKSKACGVCGATINASGKCSNVQCPTNCGSAKPITEPIEPDASRKNKRLYD